MRILQILGYSCCGVVTVLAFAFAYSICRISADGDDEEGTR